MIRTPDPAIFRYAGFATNTCATVLLCACITLACAHPLSGQTAPKPPDKKLAEEERAGCIKNLTTIYEAIRKFQLEHRDVPNWLSDLVPKYLPDANVLVCPVCLRTGKTEAPPLADPKLPSSYLFEFCPVPLGNIAPKAPQRTRREWKRRQMGLVGSSVPIVRCRHHSPVLNVAFDGQIYDSPPSWETALTNKVNPDDLSPARMFDSEAGPASRFPPRAAGTPPELLDLTPFYNARLTDSWHGGSGNDLGAVPAGMQTIAGVRFDLRGIMQLGGKTGSSTNFPAEITGVTVGRKCQRLHFLHAAAFGKPDLDGKQIATYTVKFKNNLRVDIPIVYGQHLRDWHNFAGDPAPPPTLKEVWRGENETSKRSKNNLRLFLTTWTNVVPDFEISSIDLRAGETASAPFVLGITAE